MIIKSLYLRNIRSYTEQEFSFKEGMTLLSGDIGSGKSSVLLGIEFALFGLIRGSINGSSLLRNGCKDGTIKLKFSINQNEYEIERGLKKTSVGITQDNCSLQVNDLKEFLTPVELKTKILSLLGYPDDLVTKSKTLIFRYTVYTPQEEMKQILFESKDERLEKLRRIFGVDKYELIKNNASNYAKDLRGDLRLYNSVNDEKDALSDRIRTILTEINLLKEENDSLKDVLKKLNDDELVFREKQKSLDAETTTFNELKTNNDVLVNEINSLKKGLSELNDDILELDNDIKDRERKFEKIPENYRSSDVIKKDIDELKLKREEFEKKLTIYKNQDAIIKNKVHDIKKLIEDVNHLDNCPTCKQEVSLEHKKNLITKENETLLSYGEKKELIEKNLEKAENMKKRFDEKSKNLEKERDDSIKIENKKKMIEQSLKFVNEKKEKLKLLQAKKESTTKMLELRELELVKIKDKLETFKDINEKIKKVKDDIEQITNKIRVEDKKLAANEQSIKYRTETLKEKKEELEKKEKTLKILIEKRTLENWLSNHFTNLIGIIEKNVLAKIHREFNELFKEWFSMLIEDAELEANIEQDFSPSIIQNGYDSNIENLSGGEKTAISLAYRLALNKVINDLVHDVKTKGFMILDEPTDGFSSEQLDKVRDVLDRTNTKQVIIVSHEAKLESFVQNIIRINKNNHESAIVQI